MTRAFSIPIIVLVSCLGRLQASTDSPSALMVYELYSWRSENKDVWNFSVLQGVTSRPKAPAEVFRSDEVVHGLDALDARFKKLARGSEIVWIGGSTDPGFERLEVPPEQLVDKVRKLIKKNALSFRGIVGSADASAR